MLENFRKCEAWQRADGMEAGKVEGAGMQDFQLGHLVAAPGIACKAENNTVAGTLTEHSLSASCTYINSFTLHHNPIR